MAGLRQASISVSSYPELPIYGALSEKKEVWHSRSKERHVRVVLPRIVLEVFQLLHMVGRHIPKRDERRRRRRGTTL